MEETLVRLQASMQQRMEQHTDPKDQADKMDATREVQIFPQGDKYHKIAMACPSARKASSSYEARVVKDLQVSEAFAKTLGKNRAQFASQGCSEIARKFPCMVVEATAGCVITFAVIWFLV